MRCPACGFENASGMKFCGKCGASLKLKCASCGFENAPAIKFCGECGKPFATASKSAPLPGPRSYTPKHLAEKILTSRSALAIEIARRQSAKSLELRAVLSLSRFLEKQGKKEEARRMLADIYGWFTEGFDTADLKDAKALLDALS
jgi:hypothetical protein